MNGIDTMTAGGSSPGEPAFPAARNPRAIFILAAPRSGTTLLRVMLAGHPRLFAPPELELLSFPTLAERHRAFQGRDSFWLEGLIRAVMEIRGCGAPDAREIIAACEREQMTVLRFYGLLQEWLGDRILVDKTPSYALDPRVLERAEAGFTAPFYIHLLRHPYGMIRSFEEARLDQIFFRREHSFTRRELAELIWVVSHQNVVDFLSRVPPERQHRMRFEELVRQPRRVLQGLCTAAGLELHPDMMRPYQPASRRMADGIGPESRMLGDVKFHQHADVDPAVADRWRREIEEDFLGDVAWELAVFFGYERRRGEWQRIEPVERLAGEPLPVSFAQQRLWFLDRLRPGDPSYNLPAAVRLRGALDAAALAAALAAVVRRHEALRTTFGEAAGEPVQLVAASRPVAMPRVDLGLLPDGTGGREALRLARHEAWRPFDLARGPLLRATLLALGPEDHAVLLTMHHIVSDGWSMGILVREISLLYAAFSQGLRPPLVALPIQYADYAVWQRRRLAGGALDGGLAYWRERLRSLPPAAELPADRPRPAVRSAAGGTRGGRLPADLSQALRSLSRRQGTTPFITLLAAFCALLQRYCGEDDVVVGSPVANRSRPEIEGLVGFFVNTLVLRLDLAGEPSFLALLERARDEVRSAFAHQDVPFERLVEELHPERSLSRTPLFQVMFTLQSAPAAPADPPGLRLDAMEVPGVTAKFDLSLTLVERGDGLYGVWEFSRDLFDAPTVLRLAGHLETFLRAAVADPARRAVELPLLSAAERAQLATEWTDTAAARAPGWSIPGLFRAQAARTPEAVAVSCAGQALTYRALDAWAGRIAARLRREGAEVDALVALCAERSLALVAGLLGILRAGAAYVPVDPSYPAERLAYMLDDSAASILLIQEPLLARLAGLPSGQGARVVLLEDTAGGPAAAPPGIAARLHPESLAYMIYTSGSTGRPKGAMNSHRAVCNRLLWMQEAFALTPADRVLQKTPFSFDVSVWELFWPLLVGAQLVVARPGGHRDPDYLADLIADERVTTLHFVPSMLGAFLETRGLERCTAVRRVICSGEALPADLAHLCSIRLPAAELHNLYGPTEAAVDVTWWPCQPGGRQDSVPIGRPIANTAVHLLDRRLRRVPIGVPGELHIGGLQPARGYWGRPALTAEKFIPDAWGEPGARVYKSGDLCRWRPDGAVEYLGRIDHQVKIRGFRVEPGEVETVLAGHPRVRQAAVVARDEPGGGRGLAACVVPEPGASPSAGELRGFLRSRLPEHMVPGRIVIRETLPLTPAGKVDRRALATALAQDGKPADDGDGTPRTPVEELLAGLFGEVLELGRVGTRESFFELGGHSLLATRLVNRLPGTLGVDLPLQAIFEAPTVAALAERVERELRQGAGVQAAPIRPVPRAAPLPLSFAQSRLWFLDRLAPGSTLYNLPAALRLAGDLRVPALSAALSEVVRRHEVLRTTFSLDAGGQPVQIVAPYRPLLLPFCDLRGLPRAARAGEVGRLATAAAQRPFDLARGPLLRLCLVATASWEHVVLLVLHHIVSDGWSAAVLLRELRTLYGAFRQGHPSPLPELDIQYADFAVWQRQWLQGDALAVELDYWRRRLGDGVPALVLPVDRPRPAAPSQRGAAQPVLLGAPLAAELAALGRRRGATPFMTFLAAFAALLGRYAGQSDFALGTAIAGRSHVQTEPLIGFFVNTLALRIDLAGGHGFGGLLSRVREATLGAYAHQHLPFERLLEELQLERDLARTPLFQAMLVLQNTPSEPLELPGLELSASPIAGGEVKFDLELVLAGEGGALSGALHYARELFDATTVRRLAAGLETLLRGAAADPDRPLSALPLLGAAELHQVLAEWSGETLSQPVESCLDVLLARRALATPDRAAAVWEDEWLSHGELEVRANRLAHRLRRLGIGPEKCVGLLAARSLDMLLGLAGVLKAGGAYVPLDPAAPPERLRAAVEDAGIAVLLAQRRQALPPLPGVRVLHLDDPLETAGEPAAAPEPSSRPQSLAYVLFTSGSTGRPKGVGVEHRQILSYLRGVAPYLGGRLDGSYAMLQPLTVDSCLTALLPPLLHGGLLHLIGEERALSPGGVAEYFRRHRVDVLKIAPTHLLALLAGDESAAPLPAESLILGGEVLRLDWARRLVAPPGARVYNHYGPTETAVGVLLRRVEPGLVAGPSLTVPIGRPHFAARLYLLDLDLLPVPIGARGEICIGGPCVARGYLGRPDLTAESFIPAPPWLPCGAEPGARLYRTGDLGRFLADGAVEFLGRADQQVKIRGFRVELGEIEAALGRQAGVLDAAVAWRESPAGQPRLVAYLATGGGPLDLAALQQALRRSLPEYMVPSAFASLDELPRLAHGKLDRRRLPEPAWPSSRGEAGEAASPAEELIAGLWTDLLGGAPGEPADRFFDLGGHSISAMQLAARMSRLFGVEVPLRVVFEEQTVAGQAARVERLLRGGPATGAPPLERVPRQEPLPLSFAQRRLWFLHQLEPGSSAYNVPWAFLLEGVLEVPALHAALAEVVRRHEVLRTTFAVASDGEPVQVVAPPWPVPMPLADLADLPPARRVRELRRLSAGLAMRPLDLARGPLLRATLLRLGAQQHAVSLCTHHIVSDGWSRGVLLRELDALYHDFAQGLPPSLPELAVQYADFAVWQRRRLSGEALETALAYWREQLGELPPPLELPADRPRPVPRTAGGAAQASTVAGPRAERLRELSRQHGATLFMSLLAAFQALLCRYSGERDLCVGTTTAGRGRVELERLIGFFVNTLTLRTGLTGAPGFAELVGRVRTAALGAFAHQDLPFEKLVEELRPQRDLDHTPLFQVLFELHSAPRPVLADRSPRISALAVEAETVKFDLAVAASEESGGLRIVLQYSRDLFDAVTIRRMAGHFLGLLDEMAADPLRPFTDLPLLAAAQRHQVLVEWCDSARAAGAWACAPLLMAERARLAPDAVAASCGRESLSYGGLAGRAGALAASLSRHGARHGARPETAVAVLAERGLPLLCAVAGVLAAGAAYLPLDPAHPPRRWGQLLERSGAALVLCARELVAGLAETLAEIAPERRPAVLDLEAALRPDGSAFAPRRLEPAHLAYVFYTSGSTGVPKGAMIEHRGMLNHLAAKLAELGLAAGDAVAQTASQCFDISLWQMLAALLAGGRVEIASDAVAHDPERLAAFVAEARVTVLEVVPPVLRGMLDAEVGGLEGLRWLLVTGEAFPVELYRRWRDRWPAVPVINAYGPTECSDDVTHEVLRQAPEPAAARLPVGRALANLRLRVLDRFGMPQPCGVVGELAVAGVGVGRGYLGEPERTAEVFVPDGEGCERGEPGARLYRTGDLGRWLPDGRLDLLGRLDRQVKVRGFRIELEEIEAALVSHPAVREAAVTAPEGPGGGRRLVAHLVAPQAGAAELRRFLRERLPDYMVPAAWTYLEALPKTAGGKLDRKALAAVPEEEPGTAGAGLYEPPRTPVEEMLAGVWSELLGVERVGSGDDFFALGGHSLLATQVVSRVRESFGVEVPLRALFETPDLAGLARVVEAAQRAGVGGAPPPIVRVPRESPLPLSFAQQRLWFLDRMVPDNPFYNIYSPVELSGALDVEVLRRSVREIVRRHEVLRTSFASLEDGPVQVVDPEVKLAIPLIDLEALDGEPRWRELSRLARQEGQRPFDLSRGPMLRLQVVRGAPESHVLLINVHHIAADGWSVRVLVDELTLLYEAFSQGEPSPLPELPIQYADFAVWQRRWFQGEVFHRQLSYWKSRLEGIADASLELPSDHPRPAIESFRGSKESLRLQAPLVRELRAAARGRRATLFMVLLSGYKCLLARYSRQQDVAIGTGIANRNRQEIENLIGFFVNTLVLRTDLSGLPSFPELVQRVRQTTMESYDHQDLPFEVLVEEMRPERSLNRNPLVQVMLAFQNFPRSARSLRGLRASSPQGQSGDTGTAKFDLSLFVFEQGQELLLRMEYSTDLFERVTIRRLLGHLERLLQSAVERPDLPAAELPLLSAAESRQVLQEWSDTEVLCPQRPLVHELMSRHARRRPHALAVSGAGGQLTYGELESRSNRLAHHLLCLAVGPEVRVAVCMERTPDRVVGIAAVLKAGGAYVSLDPGYPKERLAWLLEDAAVPVLLTQASLAERLPETRALVLRLDADWASVAGEEGAPPQSGAMPQNLAYVVYTSGSTGRPKGVEIPHEGLMNLVRWHQRLYGVEPADHGTQVASPAFDASIWELWPYLAGGASLYIPDEETRLSPSRMVRWWDEVGITLAYLPTPLAEGVLGEAVPESAQVRALIIGGDRLHRRPRSDVRFRLMNHYGPAEYSVTCTVVEVAPGGEGEALLPTIGRAVDNTRLYVLDRSQQPIPLGVPGELYVAGIGLARGYSGRPDLTAEKFVPDPFAAEAGERMYRTGDLVKWLPDGDLDFLGRLDFQVKLRGLRIELGEIETVLAQHPAVRDEAVLVREDRPGDKRLVAYVVQDPGFQGGGGEKAGAEHVAQWGDFFDGVYRKEPAEEDPTFNIIGWDSTYSGLPLPAAEMQEWLTDAVDRIRALAPRRVLEIGCGTGMLLFRLAGRCESYWGTDVSAEALGYVESQLARLPEKLAQVHLEQRPADRFEDLAPGSFDTVVMNSVVQYFPSVDYLVRVLGRAVEVVRPGGAIFLGDLRSLPLQKLFHTGIEMFQADPALPLEVLRRKVRARALADAELQLAPSLFYALRRELPRITRVEVYPKRGRSHNELTQFRYQVVLRLAGAAPPPAAIPWLDWQRDGASLESLGRRLREEQPAWLGVRGVPNRRVAELAEAARLLFEGEGIETAADLQRRASAAEGVEPEDVWDLAAELPYEVELGWASQEGEGRFDAVLRRRGPGGPRASDLAAWLPGPDLPPVPQPWSAYANSPLQGRFVRQLVPELRAWLGKRLPAYMVPSAFVLMDALPVTPNGKVDRRALPPPEAGSEEELVAPRSPVEETLARIWAELLRLDRVGVKDDFFELGGHSLLASRVVARVREDLGVEVPLRGMFEAPTVEALAQLVLGLQVGSQDEGELDQLLAELEGLPDDEAEQRIAEAAAGDGDG
jgi:amino acid adenylation domain-containing protein